MKKLGLILGIIVLCCSTIWMNTNRFFAGVVALSGFALIILNSWLLNERGGR